MRACGCFARAFGLSEGFNPSKLWASSECEAKRHGRKEHGDVLSSSDG
jgi:hypothetical protein